VSGTDTDATLTAVVTNESGEGIAGLDSAAFATKLDGSSVSVTFTATGSPGTYIGTLPLSGLSSGTHNVSVTVTDARSISGTGSASFGMQDTSSASSVEVASISYGTTGGKNNDKHLNITVQLSDNLGNPVSGASVSINLNRNGISAGSGTGTTGTSGTVTFVYNNAPSGCYSTTVTDVSATGLSWNGETPTNFFCK
jgi:hypothetical protein